jgi:hypothetical protein
MTKDTRELKQDGNTSLKFYTRNIVPFLRFAKIVGKDSRLSYPFLDSSHELDKILKPKNLQNPQDFDCEFFSNSM